MLRQLSILIALLAAACGDMETERLGPGSAQETEGSGSTEQEAEGPGPVKAGSVRSIVRFDNAPFLDVGHNPVVAVGPDGRVHRAAINQTTGWPEIGERGSPLPGQNRTDISTALALAADSKGNLHATWTRGRQILYAELDPDTYDGEAMVVGEGKTPNLALGVNGRVVISFVSHEDFEADLPPLLMVVEGFGGSFSDPLVTHATPSWSVEDRGQVVVNGASMALDAQGDLHLVYAWMTPDRTVVEYARTVDGAWSTSVRITEAARSPAPNIAIDQEGTVHIVYLTDNTTHVMTVRARDGILGEPSVLYIDAVNVDRAKIAIDNSNTIHLIVRSLFRGSRTRLRCVARPQTRSVNFVDIAFFDEAQALILTPGTGGAVIGPRGKLHVPFLRRQIGRSDTGTFELATSVEATRE